MRNPNYLNKIDEENDQVKVIKLDNIPDFDMPDYDLMDDREFKKYILDIKKCVRNSYEYRQMVAYLKANVDMNQCAVYKNVTNINTSKIKIHIHHEPIDIESIIRIVYRKRNAYRESTGVEDVAKEVMFLHYGMMVGLIPLAETVHELVHNRYLFIPMNRVYGAYQKFVTAYWEFFDENEKKLFNEICEASAKYDDATRDLSVLDKKYIMIDYEGTWSRPEYQDVLKLIRKRIDEIRDKKDNG